MVQELTLVTAVPVVTLTKAMHRIEKYIEVRADDPAEGLSIHYEADIDNGVPTVQEELLVAVLSGVNPEWLPDNSVGSTEEPAPITFEAVSSMASKVRKNDKENLFDMLHLAVGTHGRMKRLHVSLSDAGRTHLYAAAVLSKGQVTQMIAALLAIYPRLHED